MGARLFYPNGVTEQSPGLAEVTRKRDDGLPRVTRHSIYPPTLKGLSLTPQGFYP